MTSRVIEKRTRFKIFPGYGFTPADGKLNKWLYDNPDVKILDFEFNVYQGGHAICVMYEKEVPVNEN